MLDMCKYTIARLPPVAHVAHPRPVSWSEILTKLTRAIKDDIGKELSFVLFHEWNEKVLRAAASCDPELVHRRFPTIKLQTLFNGMAKVDQELREQHRSDVGRFEAFGPPHLVTTVCEQLSSTFRDLPALGYDDVVYWVRYWKRVRLIVRN
jgi:hypothetical protein